MEVRAWAETDNLSIQVEDQGEGFELTEVIELGRARGLTGIKERVTLLGGELNILSSPNAGTTVYTVLPIDTPSVG